MAWWRQSSPPPDSPLYALILVRLGVTAPENKNRRQDKLKQNKTKHTAFQGILYICDLQKVWTKDGSADLGICTLAFELIARTECLVGPREMPFFKISKELCFVRVSFCV